MASGDPATVDLSAEGPWIAPPKAPETPPAGIASSLDNALVLKDGDSDQLAGTVTLHNANWKSAALANHVEIAQAVLHLGGDAIVWDPVEFSDGPVKGTASLQVPLDCEAGQECLPQLDLRFDKLDAAELQAALLGAQQKSTGLSALIDRSAAELALALEAGLEGSGELGQAGGVCHYSLADVVEESPVDADQGVGHY